MTNLKFIPKTLHSIRGSRFSYKVIQTIENIPGFAPKTYDCEVCDIVVKYDAVEDDVPYLQFHDFSGTLSVEELKEITDKLKLEFDESDFTQ